jgi:hypothetical protein
MNARLVAPPSLVAKLPAARVITFAKEMTFRDIRIEALRTPHAEIEHYSYLVTWKGLRLYFTGDTESADQLLAMRELDAAFVSPWLIEEVANRRAQIDTRLLIVYHHKAGEAIADLQQRLVPKQGQSLTIEPRPKISRRKKAGHVDYNS